MHSKYLHLNQVHVWNGFWDMIKSMMISSPRENPEHKLFMQKL